MADAVSTTVLLNEKSRYAALFTNVSDGTGESEAVKVDKSALTNLLGVEPKSLDILEAEWSCDGMGVSILWDHTTDDKALVCQGYGKYCANDSGPLKDPRSAGGTGDILFTTFGHTAGDSYTIRLVLELRT